MILLADNDILLKLAGCHLLNIFQEIICPNNESIYLTPSSQFSLPSQIKKKLEQKSGRDEINSFLQKIVYLEDEVNHDIVAKLAGTPKIDVGEVQLFAQAYLNPDAYIATHDKNSLRALLGNPNLSDISSVLVNRVYTLEIALLILMKELGFEKVSQSVIERCVKDGVLDMAFGRDRDESHAIACLSSCTKEFLPLLVKSELVKLD